MTPHDANAVMAVLLILIATGALLVWASPKAASYLAQLLSARAAAREAARRVYWETFRERKPQAEPRTPVVIRGEAS